MTVCGSSGTGKTFLIHTIITAIKILTNINENVIITGPTGSSECKIYGKIIHAQFGLNSFNFEKELPKTKVTNFYKIWKYQLFL